MNEFLDVVDLWMGSHELLLPFLCDVDFFLNSYCLAMTATCQHAKTAEYCLVYSIIIYVSSSVTSLSAVGG